MNFLARFKSGPELEPETEESFARRRVLTAAKFREEELARAAEARGAQEAAAAEASVAAEAAQAAREAEEASAEDSEGDENSFEPVEPPMDWEEAVGWLSSRSPEARSFVAQSWNWEHDLRVLQFLAAQPDMDMGVAAGLVWLTGATDDFFPWGDDANPDDPQFKHAAEMVAALGRRFADDDFTHRRFGFDDSWDCSGLKERLEALYLDSRIDWTPANLPTASPGPLVTLEDVPEEERGEVRAFLDGHGN
ncbi:MAG: hypothetical protein ABIS23_05150 [Sphingomicrobium sp.]